MSRPAERETARVPAGRRAMTAAFKNRPRQGPKGRSVKLLIADQSIRVIDLEGRLIRELSLDPSRNYQPIAG